MTKYLFLMPFILLYSFSYSQTILKGEIIITGEIVEAACSINPYQKTKNSSYKYTSDTKCAREMTSGKMSPKVKVTPRKLLLTNNNTAKKNKQSYHDDYAIIYLAEYK